MGERIDHAYEGLRVIDEFFKTDSEMSQEAKLWDGLQLAVTRGWMSATDAEECFQWYRDSNSEN